MGTTDLLYLPRKLEGRGLKSVDSTYKNINIIIIIIIIIIIVIIWLSLLTGMMVIFTSTLPPTIHITNKSAYKLTVNI